MSRPKKLVGGAGVAFLLTIGAVVFVPGVFQFLDDHPWVVTGIAAFITAIATVFIAIFSLGTWRLFKYQEEMKEASLTLFRREVWAVLRQVRRKRIEAEVLEELRPGDVERDTIWSERESMFPELNEIADTLDDLAFDASEKSLDITEALLDAQRDVRLASHSLPFGSDLSDVIKPLRRAERRLRVAGNLSPELDADREASHFHRERYRAQIKDGPAQFGEG